MSEKYQTHEFTHNDNMNVTLMETSGGRIYCEFHVMIMQQRGKTYSDRMTGTLPTFTSQEFREFLDWANDYLLATEKNKEKEDVAVPVQPGSGA